MMTNQEGDETVTRETFCNWAEAEWADEDTVAEVAENNGYELSVTLDKETSTWFWRVDVTAAISEYPETWDCGFVRERQDAKLAAEEAARKAVASRFRSLATGRAW